MLTLALLGGCGADEQPRTPVELPAAIERCVESELGEDGTRESDAMIACYRMAGRPLGACRKDVVLPADAKPPPPVVAFIGGKRPCIVDRQGEE